MSMRVLPLLLALLLGGATAFAVSCGGSDRSGLIPAGDAGNLNSALDQVASATKAGECAQAGQALSRAQGAVVRLPTSVDPRLKRRIQSGIDNLRRRVPEDCKQTTSTGQPTTSTAPETQTETTQTETTQTETTQTETTPTETTQTETTPTPTVPGDTSGGVTVP